MKNKAINSDCIIPSIAGRLGNNMFMIAHAYAEALSQNKQLIVPKNQAGHMQDFLDNIFRKLDVYIDMPNDISTATMYSGYFQNEDYFKQYSEAIKQLFSPTREFIDRINQVYPFLETSQITCISVRRGDYMIYQDYHPVITKEYVDKAITLIPGADYHFIFSDDLDWCADHLDLPNSVYIHLPIHEQMWLMSLCDNFVISNSSFSWWGAYLSRNKNKMVIAPETWFGPRGPKTWKEIYCKEWIVLPTYYKEGFILPK